MLLINCAACAAPLAHNAPRCVRCWTRYCDSTWVYAQTLYKDPASTLDDLREAVTTLEETTRIARRVLGGAHPMVAGMEECLQDVRPLLSARETPSPPNVKMTVEPRK